jgi:hypothetical protein
VLGNRNISDEKFQAVVLDEIAALKVCAVGSGLGPEPPCSMHRITCFRNGSSVACMLQMRLGFMHLPGMYMHTSILTSVKRRLDSPLCGCCCVPLQNAVAAEREERVAEDDEIVAAVNDYTRALQDGLRILANS